MRYGGRETSVIESRGHRSYYKQCNRVFPLWGIIGVKRTENLLESCSPRPDVFAILPTGSGRPSFFLLFPRIVSVIKGKVGESVFHNHHRCAPSSHNETKPKRFGITATTAIAWGQAWSKTRQCESKVSVWDHLWNPRKAKKSYLKGHLAAIKD